MAAAAAAATAVRCHGGMLPGGRELSFGVCFKWSTVALSSFNTRLSNSRTTGSLWPSCHTSPICCRSW